MSTTTANEPHHAPEAPASPRTLRLGCVRYLNTLPLIEGLDKTADVALTRAAPSRLIDLLLAREVDAALISIIDAARSPEPLTLIPAGMIGCDGPTLTVRLYSATPMERVTAVHADAESHTAAALCRIILARRFDCRPAMVEFNARERMVPCSGAGASPLEWPETLLLIGDKVVTDSPPAVRYPHQLDLGEAWKAWTGLPFVYAAWACREEDASSPGVRAAAEMLDRQRRHNTTRLDWIVVERSAERGWPVDLAGEYLGRLLRYDPGGPASPARRAVDRFFAEARSLGLAPESSVRARWIDSPG